MTDRQTGSQVILGIDPGTNIMGYSVLRAEGRSLEVLAIGVIDLRKAKDPYTKLGHIFERVTGIIESYQPHCLAIEAPFFGKNVQSMLKLGRAQGVAIAAAISKQVSIHEYAPMNMLRRMLHLDAQEMGYFLDATDALAAAYCHHLQMGRPETGARKYSSWKDFALKNSSRVSK